MLLKGVNAAPSKMKVHITNLDGRDILVDLQREWTVDKVKIIAIDHFFRASESMKLSLYHKLLHVRLCKTLKEECTLLQEGVKDNDEILLLKRRLPSSTFESAEKQREDRRAPDLSTIRRMTAHLQKVTYSSKAEEPVHSVHFQTELRRILITLIEASQRILCLNPAAAEIFKQAEERLNEPAPKKRVDQVALRQLADMGFPEARARKALILNKMSVVAAMEWLFQNETDPDIDDPLPELEMCAIQDTSSLGAEGGLETNVAVSNSNQPPFRNILDSIRAFRKREFRPNHRALQRLIEMGFKENEAVDALLMFRNDQDAACDWLLGERKEQVLTVEEGLEPDSLIYQAIMDNPVVQLGLNNPRCLLAFLQMLENPLLANQWLSDPETGPILMQVSRIYQMRLDIEGIASSTSSNEVASTSSTSTFVSTSLPSTLFTTTSVSTLSISPSNPTTTLEPALSVSPSNPTTTSVSTLSLSPSTVPSETVPASPTVLLMPTTLSTSTSDPSHTSSSKPFFSSGTR